MLSLSLFSRSLKSRGKSAWTTPLPNVNVNRQKAVEKESKKGKGKVHPRTGHEGPEGGQMYSSTLPSTSALVGGGWLTPRPGRFTAGKDPVPIVQEAGWAPGAVWTGAENLAVPSELYRPVEKESTVTFPFTVLNNKRLCSHRFSRNLQLMSGITLRSPSFVHIGK